MAPSTARPALRRARLGDGRGRLLGIRRLTRGGDQQRVLAHERPSNESIGGYRRRRSDLTL